MKRVRPFIHGVPGNRGRRAALFRQQRRHLDVVHRDFAEHGLLPRVGLGAEGRAFEELAVEIRKRLGEPGADRGCRKNRAIAAAAADDDIGPRVEQLDVRVDARHGDDVLGRRKRREIERRPPIQPLDHGALLDDPPQTLLQDRRMEVPNPEFRQAMLPREILDDLDEEIDPAVGSRVAGRTDDHRHAEPARAEKHQLEIMHLPLERARRDVGTERPGSDVVRSRIGADEVGGGAKPDLVAAGPDRCETKMSVRADDTHRPVVGAVRRGGRGGHGISENRTTTSGVDIVRIKWLILSG